ncbi:type II toxin-antitoxin system RelE/ParE family toxin [Candidatus Peregrinibacteria bacterium]|nr:type II toxin-antitoxin system RelE/ParE family toxin [Candidatus Peregrinibacteria bacterium]
MIEVLYKPTFVRQYKKLPSALQEEIKEKLVLFAKNPKYPFLKTHKLKGKLKGFYSFSVNYEYRIVFIFESKKSAVMLAVGDHDIYK